MGLRETFGKWKNWIYNPQLRCWQDCDEITALMADPRHSMTGTTEELIEQLLQKYPRPEELRHFPDDYWLVPIYPYYWRNYNASPQTEHCRLLELDKPFLWRRGKSISITTGTSVSIGDDEDEVMADSAETEEDKDDKDELDAFDTLFGMTEGDAEIYVQAGKKTTLENVREDYPARKGYQITRVPLNDAINGPESAWHPHGRNWYDDNYKNRFWKITCSNKRREQARKRAQTQKYSAPKLKPIEPELSVDQLQQLWRSMKSDLPYGTYYNSYAWYDTSCFERRMDEVLEAYNQTYGRYAYRHLSEYHQLIKHLNRNPRGSLRKFYHLNKRVAFWLESELKSRQARRIIKGTAAAPKDSFRITEPGMVSPPSGWQPWFMEKPKKPKKKKRRTKSRKRKTRRSNHVQGQEVQTQTEALRDAGSPQEVQAQEEQIERRQLQEVG